MGWSEQPLAEQAEELFKQVNARHVAIAKKHPEGVKKIVHSEKWAEMEEAIERTVASDAKAAFDALSKQYSERAHAFYDKWEERLDGTGK